MKKRMLRILPLILTCLFLMAGLVSFASAITEPQGPVYDKWEVRDVLGNREMTVSYPDGSFRIDLSTIEVIGIKQSTYMLVWSRESLNEQTRQDVINGFRNVDPSNYTDFAFYHGEAGVFAKPSFWEKGNSFGRYEVVKTSGTFYLTIGSTKSVSHFIFGLGSSPPSTTTTEPTTTTTESTTTTTEPSTTTTESTTTTTEPTTTTTEPSTTTTEPSTTTTESSTTTTEPSTTTTESSTTTTESPTTTTEPSTTTTEPSTTTTEPSTTTTTEPSTTTTEPTTTTTSIPDEVMIEEEDVPLVSGPEDPNPPISPKTGHMDVSWMCLAAAAVSLTAAILLNRRPSAEE